MVEEAWARLSVLAPLAMGYERATLVFTDSRVIVAHLEKRSGRFLLGRLGNLLVGVLKSRGEARKRRLVESSSPDELLTADPSNFAVNYDSIGRAELRVHRPTGESELVLLTEEEKLLFRLAVGRPPGAFEEEMQRILGDRFSLRLSSH